MLHVRAVTFTPPPPPPHTQTVNSELLLPAAVHLCAGGRAADILDTLSFLATGSELCWRVGLEPHGIGTVQVRSIGVPITTHLCALFHSHAPHCCRVQHVVACPVAGTLVPDAAECTVLKSPRPV